MKNFDFEQPSTVAAAATALSDGDATALAGGQTLLPTLKMRLASPGKLVSLTGIAEMQEIGSAGDNLRIGGAVIHADVAAGGFGSLSTLAGCIGDPAVRNRGTIGGSLANNDPAADYPAVVLGLGATVNTNTRSIASDDFFQGMFETALDDGEIITSVDFPKPDTACYVKFDQPASRFALVGVYVSKTGNDVRVAVTGASASGVFRWAEAEAALSSNFSAAALAGLSANADDMIGDLHGTPEYRAHLVGVMTARAVDGC